MQSDVSAKNLARNAATCRRAGCFSESKEIIKLGQVVYPKDKHLAREAKRLKPRLNPETKGDQWLAKIVDKIGMAAVFFICSIVVYLLAPLFFVSAT